jgi:hypothetical protein
VQRLSHLIGDSKEIELLEASEQEFDQIKNTLKDPAEPVGKS